MRITTLESSRMEGKAPRLVRLDEIASRPAARWAVRACLAALFVVLGFAHFHSKIADGKGALLRWRPQISELLAGRNIYLPWAPGTDNPDQSPANDDPDEKYGYEYPHPPFAAVHLIPYAKMPLGVAAGLWFALKALAFLFALKLIFTTLEEAGQPLGLASKAVVFLISLRAAWSDLQHGNLNLFILFLCALSFWAFRHRRAAICGLAVAVAASLKVTPALIIVYFLYKRAWKACIWAAVGLLVCNLLIPWAVFGLGNTIVYSRTWFDVMVNPTMIEGKVETEHINQSLQAVFLRLFTATADLTDGDSQLEAHGPPVIPLRGATTLMLVRILLVGWVGLLAFLCRAPPSKRDNFFLLVEFSLVLLSMLYLNERSWKHHYVLLAFPVATWVYALQRVFAVGAGQQLLRPRPWIAFLALSFAIVLGSGSDVIGGYASDLLEWYGSMFFASLILFVGCAVLAVRARRRGWSSLSESLELRAR